MLIDADNAQASVVSQILGEIAKFGEATVKRIYGDFTSPHSASWKKVLQVNAIKPVQQFAYSTGKNATDSSLIIDAMDLLYTRKFDGFCLVTSDSDFTGLATRLREEGLLVFGFGESKTPDAFRSACHKFILAEVILQSASELDVPECSDLTTSKASCRVGTELPATNKLPLPEKFLLDALEQSTDETGWANLGLFGSYLTKLKPDFDSRTYGYKKLTDLVKNNSCLFVFEERVLPNQKTQLLVKAK